MCHLFLVYATALFTTAVTATDCPVYTTRLVTGIGKDAADLQPHVMRYRSLLNGPNNGNRQGPGLTGHRTITWDSPNIPFQMKGNYFAQTVTRGIVFQAQGDQFRVSNPRNKSTFDDRFDSILPSFAVNDFIRFSKSRLFMPFLSNRMSIFFKLPATNTRAGVAGLGAVFVDVDFASLSKNTTMAYYDRYGCHIRTVRVPQRNRMLSFAGLVVIDPNRPAKRIAAVWRVHMKLGLISARDLIDAPKPINTDLVVLDNIIYGEPTV